jgi:uncharacterized protein YjbI with pentapeptide repeats
MKITGTRVSGPLGMRPLAMAGFIVIASANSALACSCFTPTATEAVRSTPIIFTGRVESTRTEETAPLLRMTTAMHVLEQWKGEVPPQVTVLQGDVRGSGCGLFRFSVGQTFLVLAYPLEKATGAGATVVTSICTMSATYRQREQISHIVESNRDRRDVIEAALQASPRSPELTLELGKAFEELNSQDRAVSTFESVIAQNPDFMLGHLALARVLLRSKQPEKAEIALARAEILAPGSADVVRLRVEARIRAGDRTVLEGRRDFSGLVLPALDLTRRDLRGADFTGSHIGSLRLAGADLRGARFNRAKVGGFMVMQADLRNADLSGLQAEAANLMEAKLDRARLDGLRLIRPVMILASLRDVVGSDIELQAAHLSGAVFDGARLSKASFRNADVRRASFQRTRLRDADYSGADFDGTDLSTADIQDTRFKGASYSCKTRLPRGFEANRLEMFLAGPGAPMCEHVN